MSIAPILAMIVALVGPTQVGGEVDYSKEVKPILRARCFACHGALKQKGGLRLDTAVSAIRGGREPAIAPGDVDSSPLIHQGKPLPLAVRIHKALPTRACVLG
jgi:hypothetical protein